MNKLSNIRARPEGIQNALIMMYANAIGKSTLPKRVPISVRPLGNDNYEVFDGNSTYNIAKQSGWKQMPARIVDDTGNPIQ